MPQLAVDTTPASVVDELVMLFEDVLGIDGVKPTDDFFELGGDSLVAVKLVAKIRASLVDQVSLRDLFEASNPQALSSRLLAMAADTGISVSPPTISQVSKSQKVALMSQVVAIFVEVLATEEPVGFDADFFGLGGNSLDAVNAGNCGCGRRSP